jgi:hypothetical protein
MSLGYTHQKEDLDRNIYLWPPYSLSYKWKDFLALRKPIILFLALFNVLILTGLLVAIMMVIAGFIDSPEQSIDAAYTVYSPYGIFAGILYLFIVRKLLRDLAKTFYYLLMKKIY